MSTVSNYFKVISERETFFYPFTDAEIKTAWLRTLHTASRFTGARISVWRAPAVEGPWSETDVIGDGL